jgi:DNA-binding NarL/FixJ family response regulator
MARVAASGKPWVSRKGRLVTSVGRPKLDPAMRREIAQRLAAGDTPYRIGKDMGISKNTVAKYGEAHD